MLAKGPDSYILGTESSWTDGQNVYDVMRGALMTVFLVIQHNYNSICWCSAVLKLVPDGGVSLTHLNTESKVG